ncbi:MAG TPA: hypothetical protein PLE04_11580 [Syntrophales bacterium]|nr:hypothetical protein [Syntrophales bacterium]
MEEYRKMFDEWLRKWDWEWFLSLSLASDDYEEPLLRFVRALQKEERLQLAYLGVFSSLPAPHLHLLALGKDNAGRSLNSLGEVKRWFWMRRWQGITHLSGDIRPVMTKDDVTGYIAHRNTPENCFELVHPYNQRLLKRAQLDTKTVVSEPKCIKYVLRTVRNGSFSIENATEVFRILTGMGYPLYQGISY